MHRIIQPDGWAKAKGYANGVLTEDGHLFVAGQFGWSAEQEFEATDLAGQTRQALSNVRDVVETAGGCVADIVRMAWYVADGKAYRDAQEEIRAVYRDVMGRHFPAMTVVLVAGLVEEAALVEIEAAALVRGELKPQGDASED